jgi:hypothetical protein
MGWGQMGTEIEKLQHDLIQLSKSLGWSNKQLAKEIYYELSDDDDPLELNRFCESFKKGLQRGSIDSQRLQEYMEVVCRTPVFLKQKKVKPIRPDAESFSEHGKRKLESISRMISDGIEEQLYIEE